MPKIYEQIWLGSYPALNEVKGAFWEDFYNSYLQTYIERDIRDVVQMKHEHEFLQVLRLLAARTGQLLNYTDIARDVGITSVTVKSWLGLLEASGIIFFLEPYFANINKQIIKTPKVYFMDTGLVAYLTGWRTSETLSLGAMKEQILETYVISEIRKSWTHHGKRAPIFYFRDKKKHEIDLLIEENGLIYPIEIKSNSNPTIKDCKSFSVLENCASSKIDHGAIISLACKDLPLTKDISIVPLSYI